MKDKDHIDVFKNFFGYKARYFWDEPIEWIDTVHRREKKNTG